MVDKGYLEEFIKTRQMIKNGDETWEAVMDLRTKYGRPTLSKDTVRKGVLIYDEFNEAGWIQPNNVDNFESNSITELKKDGSVTSDKIVKLAKDELNSAEALLKAHGFDSNEYELVSARSSKWQQKSKEGVQDLYSSRITVAPRKVFTSPDFYRDLLNEIEVDHKKEKAVYSNYTNNGELLVLGYFDIHWGAYSDEMETGVKNDLHTARERLINNLDSYLSKFKDRKFERVLFPIGQDFFNSTYEGATFAHKNKQDNVGTFKEIFRTGLDVATLMIEKASNFAPVDVIIVPGNHAYYEDFMLGMCVEAYFRNDKSVNVFAGPSDRKYYKFGKTLIGCTHGCDEKKENLANLMACERANDWANTNEHIFLVGHTHAIKETKVETNGVVFITIPAIRTADSWTYRKGYVASNRSMALIIDKVDGLVETHYVKVK